MKKKIYLACIAIAAMATVFAFKNDNHHVPDPFQGVWQLSEGLW